MVSAAHFREYSTCMHYFGHVSLCLSPFLQNGVNITTAHRHFVGRVVHMGEYTIRSLYGAVVA